MSDQDKKTEEIKALLRKKLEGMPPADDGWNIPSTSVWSGLSEELGTKVQPKQERSWAARLATIIAALLVILFWRECSNQRQLTSLRSEVDKVSSAYDKLQEACNEKQTITVPAANTSSDPAAGEVQQSERINRQLPSGNRESGKASTSPTLFHKGTKREDFNSETIEKNDLQTGVVNPAPVLVSPNLIESVQSQTAMGAAQQTLQRLPFPYISNFYLNGQKPKLDLHLPHPKDPSASVMLIASLYGGLALTGNSLSGQKPAIVKDQQALLTWRTGLGLELAFNQNWSLISGVDYNLSRIETDYNLAVPYTHNGEFQHDDGNFDNQYNHSLPSSLGNYPAQFVLTRANNAQVAEGEVMNLELSIRQKTRFVSLPLQLRYGFGQNKWQAGAKAGFFANHVLGISNEKPKLISHHGAIHERQTSIGTPPLNDLQQWTFDWTLGTDVRYQLSPKFGLSLNASFQRGITPVYKDALVKNYLHAWNLGAGIQYFLR